LSAQLTIAAAELAHETNTFSRVCTGMAAFEPIASRVMLVEGPGITGADLNRLTFTRVRRPIWPIDRETEWSSEQVAV
jgi:microcystin degradation protein MlrC